MISAIIGLQWGDEGKGKIVDYLAQEMKSDGYVVRFNGGANAGHTIIFDGKKIKNHILPGGVCRGLNAVIGPSVYFDPMSFFNELDAMNEQGMKSDMQKIFIDKMAAVVFPWHKQLDGYKESLLESSSGKIGTTKRGIGPVAMDLAERYPVITVEELVNGAYAKRIAEVIDWKKEELIAAGAIPFKKIIPFEDVVEAKMLNPRERLRIRRTWKEYKESQYWQSKQLALAIDNYTKQIIEEYSRYAERLKACRVCITREEIEKAVHKAKDILFEGAQGALLDMVLGTRPFVTSSRTIGPAAGLDFGITDGMIEDVIGVVKAYPTRVGEGPFPSKIDPDSQLSKAIINDGGEYGTTTGRPRYPGYPDMVALKYAIGISGITKMALTKIDVLSGKEGLKLVNKYFYADLNEASNVFDIARLGSAVIRDEDCEPISPLETIVQNNALNSAGIAPEHYETEEYQYTDDKYSITTFDDLSIGIIPRNWHEFIERIEEAGHEHSVEVEILSYGPDTKDTIECPISK